MAEPLEINISKSFVEHGGKQWATYENGGTAKWMMQPSDWW